MKKLNATIEIENMITKTLADAAAEKKAITDMLKDESAAVDKATEEMNAATIAGDVKAYQKAKAARQNAADAKEMHEARLTILAEKALITPEEYETAVNRIYAENAALEDEAKQAIIGYSEKMNTVAISLEDAMTHANNVLRRLQSEIYRDQDRRRDSAGEIVRIPTETKEVNNWNIINWGKRGVKSAQYAHFINTK